MTITGVYFIPSNPNASTALNTITERLRSAFTDEDLMPMGRWVLEHKLMRDTPGCLANPPTKPRYMQFLSLSHYPNHGFIYTTEPPEKPYHPPGATSSTPSSLNSPAAGSPSTPSTSLTTASPPTTARPAQSNGNASNVTGPSDSSPMLMTTVPPSAYGTLFQHFTYACQPFWCHRLTVAVPNGVVFEIGDFRVRIGEVRQTYPAARLRGTVVEIEWRGPSVIDSLPSRSSHPHKLHSPAVHNTDQDADSGIKMFSALEDSDIDAEYAATASLIREFWARLRVDGAREAILVPGLGTEVKCQLRKLKEKGLGYECRPRNANGSAGLLLQEEDPDPHAGADAARQFMEVLRFSR